MQPLVATPWFNFVSPMNTTVSSVLLIAPTDGRVTQVKDKGGKKGNKEKGNRKEECFVQIFLGYSQEYENMSDQQVK